ncbi:MAG: COQ9 family protein [Hyphomonadaceae bacterium]|nr:COQ9 family protein [Hyphomonadaceae bacterium]
MAAQREILGAVLRLAPFYGWTHMTLRRAVNDTDLPDGAEELYFPGGPLEVIRFWSSEMDHRTAGHLTTESLRGLRVRDRVARAVLARLEALGGHEEAARRAVSRLSLPGAVGQATGQLWATSDMIWRAIGDTSTDGNFYSKRAILSGVIGTTLLSWLSDDGEGKTKARAFLDARIADVMQFENLKRDIRKRTENMPNPVEVLGRLRYGKRRKRRQPP